MKPSAELREAMLRMYEATTAGDASQMLRLISRQEGVLAIGTDPDEWWEGIDAIERVYATQLPELGSQLRLEPGDVKAYAEGSVGWAADQAILQVLGRELPVRLTTVFHKEDGQWKIVLHHVSMGVANAEALGKDLTTQ